MSSAEDFEEIRALRHRYFVAMDMGDADGLRSVLAEDLETDLQGASYHIRYDNRDAFIEFVTSVIHSDSISNHFGVHPIIEITGPDTAKGVWHLQDWLLDRVSRRVRKGAAIIRDDYARIDGRWQIKRYAYGRIWEIDEDWPGGSAVTESWLEQHGRKPHERAALNPENVGTAAIADTFSFR